MCPSEHDDTDSDDEAAALKSWALATYSNRYTQLILTTFATVQSVKG